MGCFGGIAVEIGFGDEKMSVIFTDKRSVQQAGVDSWNVGSMTCEVALSSRVSPCPDFSIPGKLKVSFFVNRKQCGSYRLVFPMFGNDRRSTAVIVRAGSLKMPARTVAGRRVCRFLCLKRCLWL